MNQNCGISDVVPILFSVRFIHLLRFVRHAESSKRGALRRGRFVTKITLILLVTFVSFVLLNSSGVFDTSFATKSRQETRYLKKRAKRVNRINQIDQPSVNGLRCILRDNGLEAVISEYYLDVLDSRRERSTVMAVFFTFHLFGD